mgnify:CR=1 FL=1
MGTVLQKEAESGRQVGNSHCYGRCCIYRVLSHSRSKPVDVLQRVRESVSAGVLGVSRCRGDQRRVLVPKLHTFTALSLIHI